MLGCGIVRVKDVRWRKGLGLARAMGCLEVTNFGRFIVESDMIGDSLFERESAKIAANLHKVCEGARPTVQKRFGETDDRSDEMI